MFDNLKPQEQIYKFDTKEDFVKFYSAHRDAVDHSTLNGSAEIKFFFHNGDVKIFGIPDANESLKHALDSIPDDTRVELFKTNITI